jgi:hypothetical protein
MGLLKFHRKLNYAFPKYRKRRSEAIPSIVTRHSSLVTRRSSFVIRHWLLGTGCWLLAYWLLVIRLERLDGLDR